MWVAMLKSFSKHLREKGWFDICTIAMDERPMEVMQKTLQVIRKADPEFKVSLAGNFHKELEADIYDYCILSELLIRRRYWHVVHKTIFLLPIIRAVRKLSRIPLPSPILPRLPG